VRAIRALPRPTPSGVSWLPSVEGGALGMATKLKAVDVVTVGVGLTGTILAKELADLGLKVVGLERGGWRDTHPDFDMPHAHDEREPHFDRFEYLYGICGKAGNLKGQIRPGGNPFEGPRSRDYPNPPMKTSHVGALYGKAAKELGYHPFPAPSANMTRPYTNPYGVTLGACVYCGYCERFGCEMGAKASPQTTVLPVLIQ